MPLLLQDFVPYPQSVLWRIHDAYFQTRSSAAWRSGEIPSFSTSNYAFARQVARFLIHLTTKWEASGQLRPTEPVWVWELGCGNGLFARNLLVALEHGCGPRGRALRARLQLVLSDYAEVPVREALRVVQQTDAQPVLPPIGALLDLRQPEALRGLDGSPLTVGPVQLMIASYLCCVLPVTWIYQTQRPQNLQPGQHSEVVEDPFSPDVQQVFHGAATTQVNQPRYFTKYVRISADVVPTQHPAQTGEHYLQQLLAAPIPQNQLAQLQTELSFRPAELATLLPSPVHQRTLQRAVQGLTEATVEYPSRFLDAVSALVPRLAPGGQLLVSDFGSHGQEGLRGQRVRGARLYGSTLNHAVDFALLEAYAHEVGLSIVRTSDPLRALHSACFSMSQDATVTVLFRRHLDVCSDGEDLVDFRQKGVEAMRATEFARAGRFFARCLKLDPRSAELWLWLGRARLQAGALPHAERALRKGQSLDPPRRPEFQRHLGQVYAAQGQHLRALRCLQYALQHQPTAATYVDQAESLRALGRRQEALQACEQALALDEQDQSAEQLWMTLQAELDRPAPPASLPMT